MKSPTASWLAFFVGGLLIAMVAGFMMDSHRRLGAPGSSISFSSISPVETPAIPAPHNEGGFGSMPGALGILPRRAAGLLGEE
jgi:hypothetical protein